MVRYNQCGHQVLRIISVDAATDEASAIIDERSETFITHSSGKTYVYWPDDNELIWMSERDGWNHLYLYDAKTGRVKNQITRGEWVVRSVDHVDVTNRQIWFQAGGPHLDIRRVGIYGTSAGGQSALGALLTHGDFYKAAVSDCGCHDNRMDKIWWNEQWMGWPVGPHYAEQSNVTHASKLQGKLLLMVGEMGRNVDPASTMQVVNALIKANKDFDFVVVPGAGHGVAGSPYGRRRLQDFFVRHLFGREPRWTDAAAN